LGMSRNPDQEQFLVYCTPDLAKEKMLWLSWASDQKRMSSKTLDAYERDVRQFLQYMTGHVG